MNIPNKTKRNTLILTTLVLIVSWVVGYMFLGYQFKHAVDEQFIALSANTEKLFNLNLENQKKGFEFKLNNIISAPDLSKAVANRDYKELKSIVSVYYERLKSVNNNIKILTFRSSDGVTLYRAHKPEFYGDKVDEKRKLIMDTNRQQSSFSGFEVGKLEMTYRITKPIFYKNKYVGNVELGMDPTSYIKDFNSIFKIDIGVAIDKALVSIMLDSSVVSINQNYVLLSGSEKLKEYFTTDKDAMSDLFKVKMDIPLKNHLSETLGYLVVGFDASEVVQRDKDFMINLFFMIALLILLLGIILHQGFERILKQFSEEVYTDHLTGLKNRQALNMRIYTPKTHTLILSNIKEFSLLNELYGIDVGNQILIETGKAFEKFALEHKLDIFRISSDEYVLLKENDIYDVNYFNELIQNLHRSINSLEIWIEGLDHAISIEIYSGLSFDHSHVLEESQMALKKAKERGVPYLAYSEHVDTKKRSGSIIQVKRTIRHALEHNNVVPYFQPIMDRSGKIVKYEALIRIVEFENGIKKVLTPDVFLETSMKSGLYFNIEKIMIERSLSYFLKKKEQISINLLPNDLFNPFIMDTLLSQIKKYDAAKRIIVEITEQEGVEDFERTVKMIKMLKNLGVMIAIDDFGSGYANYMNILKMEPDYIKIDGSLIKNILTDSNSRILVTSIIKFAKELNIKIIAEFVENIEIFEILKEYGVDEFQGYYFSRPLDLLNQ
ncbi:EAL domain-containing protein [bacterium]|nr:EAL domain-containing protein [bacterium]MBU1994594.1 EAL domain-containing protein [bacterium]